MSRFRKSARALAAAVLLAAVTLLALLSPTPGHAQTVNTYLSNFGQGMDHYDAFQDNRAQSFRTGPQAGGYTVTSVDIVSEDPQGDAFSAAIYSVDSNGYPDSQVAALTAPSSFAAGTLTFTAPANTTLSANTTYTVRIVKNDSSPAVVLSLDSTTSNAEDMGGASGWSIGNGTHRWDSHDGAWYLNSSTGAIRIAVKGTTTVNNPATGAPAITGPAQVGQTLTAVISSIMDADGLNTPGYTYRWIRVDGSIDADIPGATSSAYALVAADRGKTIKVRVSFTDDASFSETLTSAATAAAANNLATGAPTITGPAQVERTSDNSTGDSG